MFGPFVLALSFVASQAAGNVCVRPTGTFPEHCFHHAGSGTVYLIEPPLGIDPTGEDDMVCCWCDTKKTVPRVKPDPTKHGKFVPSWQKTITGFDWTLLEPEKVP